MRFLEVGDSTLSPRNEHSELIELTGSMLAEENAEPAPDASAPAPSA